MMQVTYSNRIEELFLRFISRPPLEQANPFVLRLVAVPSVRTQGLADGKAGIGRQEWKPA